MWTVIAEIKPGVTKKTEFENGVESKLIAHLQCPDNQNSQERSQMLLHWNVPPQV